LEINFNLADRFFRETLRSIGRKTRDQKRREEKAERGSRPFDKEREPISAAEGVEMLLDDFDWQQRVDKQSLLLEWDRLIGPENAAASTPREIRNGTLSIGCRSTAWATQLRLLKDQILARIQEQYPDLGVKDLVFFGPAAPSWKKGPRSVPGRGPRDTYG
jgi:predicted nucleic acid-binding Zn ribbon protein